MNNTQPKLFSIKEILTTDDYIIPMYQRNYAWEEKEIIQLLEDIADYVYKSSENNNGENYYIGSLVVYNQNHQQNKAITQPLYEVIDGQQRLTTLTLLAIYLYHKELFSQYGDSEPNLRFECRESSSNTIHELFKNKIIDYSIYKDDCYNFNIINGYKIIDRNIVKVLREKFVEKHKNQQATDELLTKLATYFFNHVKILRVEVPADTDLNHYFEVMNNRGEQLEKHEIIKARLLERIQKDNKENKLSHIVNHIWESTSDMNSYIQSKFTTEQRKTIFSKSLSEMATKDFSNLEEIEIHKSENIVTGTIDEERTIDNIITNHEFAKESNAKSNNQKSMRFSSLINFENFLLHVLRISTNQDVSLDDKNLITAFDKYLFNETLDENNQYHSLSIEDRVYKFAYDLLKCKFLFDNFIIKREQTETSSKWSLKKYSKYDGSSTFKNRFDDDKLNQQIRMLLASLHVSIPTYSYKYWLNGSLFWLFNQETATIDGQAYLQYLESLANNFMFNRYLSSEKASYYQMIHVDKCHFVANDRKFLDLLRYQNIENIFVFNYLDYLIWKNENDEPNSLVKGFEFSARSSIEHFYAQTPDGYAPLNEDDVHSFGNLFLLSHSQNSSLSNKPPKEKIANFLSTTNANKSSYAKSIPTLKLLKLIHMIDNSKNDITEERVYSSIMHKHENQMIDLLKQVCSD